MKVTLTKPFFGRKEGSVVTMHPSNARMYAHMGVCAAMTEKEQEYLNTPLPCKSKRVENQIKARAAESAMITHEVAGKADIPVHDNANEPEPKSKRGRRRKQK